MTHFLILSRFLTALLFIFSGIVKANDPIGFSYKLDEYWEVFGIMWMQPYSLALSIFVSSIEVALGLITLLGIRMRLTAWLLLLMMLFFTFLKASTVFNNYFIYHPKTFSYQFFIILLSLKVENLSYMKDCGCFGDAIKFEPWQSLLIDIISLIPILVLFIYRKKIQSSIGGIKGDITAVLSLLASFAFTFYCYWHLPIVDFRPFKIGSNIQEQMIGVPDSIQYTYVLKNKASGEQKDFDRFPENYQLEWDYVEAKEMILKKGMEAPIHDFFVTDMETGEDITDSLLSNPDYSFWVVVYDVKNASHKADEKINTLIQETEKNNLQVIGISASLDTEINEYRHQVQAMYPFYLCDATPLKTMIRSNPGLMLIKNGTVIDMWHYNDIPSFEEVALKYQIVNR
jgi:uncharacterized membrane protein YphA (DoxX/SURF4 family)